MSASLVELAEFREYPKPRKEVEIEGKIDKSSKLLRKYVDRGSDVLEEITADNFRWGVVPRLSPHDVRVLPEGTRLVRVPEEIVDKVMKERSYDLITWNLPDRFLKRLEIGQKSFVPPVEGNSRVIDRLSEDGIVVSFDDLRSTPPEPVGKRYSRTENNNGQEINIAGQARIPFALGSVPDVGSFLSYVTMAQANGMALVSRDKQLSDISEQAKLVGEIINYLRNGDLTEAKELVPNDAQLTRFLKLVREDGDIPREQAFQMYEEALRESWVGNVGAAIEASDKGLRRAEALYDVGCRLFRVYSPEGGLEIPQTVKELKDNFGNEARAIGGQVMHVSTGQRTEEAGADALMTGISGGSQCSTSVMTDIPVSTPNFIYDLRGKVGIPIGIEGGGVGTHVITALNLGASFLSKPGEIGVSLEGAGGKLLFADPQERYYMIYGGEASRSAKWWKDSMDSLGRPNFVEGETGIREVTEDRISMTRNLRNLLEDELSTGLAFQHAFSISELHSRDCSGVVQVTRDAAEKSKPYAT